MSNSRAVNDKIKSRQNPLRAFYNWSLEQCEKPYSFWFVNTFAFLESIIIPIPTDPLLIAKATAEPKKALNLAFWVSVFSVAGGVAGYFIGDHLWASISPFIFKYVLPVEIFIIIQQRFTESVFLFVVLGGFTPLPFKAFALSAGSMGLPFIPFLLGCIVGRGLRFMALGCLVYFYGPQIKGFIDKWLEVIFIILGLLVALLIALKYLI